MAYGPPDRPSGGVRARRLAGRLLPVALAFAVVLTGLLVFHPRLREAIGTEPGSPRSGAATHELYDTGRMSNRCVLPADRDSDVDMTLRVLSGCLDRVWTGTLARIGREYTPPAEVNLVRDPGEASCGTDDYDWAGIYCPDSRSVNVLVEDDWTFSAMFTLAHEYAHHIQEITGIATQSGSEVFDDAWSRRLELQADCLAAVTLRDIDYYGLSIMRDTSAEDDNSAMERHTHGSPANSSAWISKGQREGTVGSCNTWSAPTPEVS